MAPSLSFDVERTFRGGATIRAQAELPLDDGPVTVLFGPSGSGKSTALRALAGLDPDARGTISLAGEPWLDSSRAFSVPPQRRRVGFLFQDYALFPHLTVAGNVGYGLFGLGREARARRVAEVAGRLRIGDLLERRPAELSGGQRQRVALARALAPAPRLLLLDEPLSALDAPTREELRAELRRALEGSGVPAVVVTHDRVEALALGDRIAVMIEGRIRQVGPVREVFAGPSDLAVARVVGTENVLPVRLAGRGDGLVTVRAGEVELVAVDPGGLEAEAFACIRAEEVVLEEAAGAASSARNRLPGTVTARSDEGPLVRVRLDCGVPLVALVTRPSAEAMGLLPGRRVTALVKAPAVRLVAR
ncbi:MAG TPA: ABC transporter ATP-binding protein [Anaeromyxobacteraceae bacterium]|nr:ABC transporter ATP-binding protein [Anaeromyxobacteraceae bacterium]